MRPSLFQDNLTNIKITNYRIYLAPQIIYYLHDDGYYTQGRIIGEGAYA